MKKRVMVLSILPVGIVFGYLFYLGCVLGYFICKYCGGVEAGVQGRVRSIIIPLSSYEIHLHHWFLSSMAAVVSAVQGFFLIAPGLFYGVLGGLILQGILCYGDWHRIVRRRCLTPVLEQAESTVAGIASGCDEMMGFLSSPADPVIPRAVKLADSP